MRVLSVADRYDDHPEELLITVSRVKDASCLYRYYKNYVERPRREQAFVSIENGVGSFFHAYVEDWFKAVAARGGVIADGDALDVDDLVRRFRLAFLWRGELRAPYRIVRHGACFDDFVARLQAVARHFNEFLPRHLAGCEVVAVEGALQIRTDSLYVRGKYDLISRAADGRLMLWDWKSGRLPKAEYHDDYLHQKVQLGIYATWMRHKFGTSEVEGAAVFLRDAPRCLSEAFTPEVERMVLDYLHTRRERLNRVTTWPPSPSALCDWCGWKPACPAFANERDGPPNPPNP